MQINFKISKHLVSLRLKFKKIRQVEPPSPIVKEQKISADQMSDDPLSRDIYMIMGETFVSVGVIEIGRAHV